MIQCGTNSKSFLIDNLYILHTTNLYSSFLRQFENRKVNVSDKISILTICNKPERAYLFRQLNNCGIKYTNSNAEGFVNNASKIDYFAELLANTKTEYALLCDAFDVAILKDLDDEFIDKCNSYGKDFIFSICHGFPSIIVRDYEKEDTYFINAGLVFGKTKVLADFYKNVSDFKKEHYEEEPQHLRKSEQYWLRLYLISKGQEFIPNYGLETSMMLLGTHSSPRYVGNGMFSSWTYNRFKED